MDDRRTRVLPVGLALGLLFVVVGLVQQSYGLAGFGVLVALAGYVARSRPG